MKKEDLIKKLENIELPKAKLPKHQHRLKMALLDFGYSKKSSIFNFIVFWKGIKKDMFKFKKIIPVGIVAVIALVVFIGINPSNPSNNAFTTDRKTQNLRTKPIKDNHSENKITPHQAYAMELVKATQTSMAGGIAGFVDPSTNIIQWKKPDNDGNIRDEKGNIVFTTQDGKLVPTPRKTPANGNGNSVGFSETITGNSYMKWIKQAEQAKDLTYIGDKVMKNGKKVKILRYTDKEKNTHVILGIDKNNYPVVRLAYTGGISGGGAVATFGSGELNRKTPPNFNLEDQLNYWTKNLENSTIHN